MVDPARRAGLEGAVLDAEGALGHVALEADSDRPAPEAREAAMFGRWETTELLSTLLDQGFKKQMRPILEESVKRLELTKTR